MASRRSCAELADRRASVWQGMKRAEKRRMNCGRIDRRCSAATEPAPPVSCHAPFSAVDRCVGCAHGAWEMGHDDKGKESADTAEQHGRIGGDNGLFGGDNGAGPHNTNHQTRNPHRSTQKPAAHEVRLGGSVPCTKLADGRVVPKEHGRRAHPYHSFDCGSRLHSCQYGESGCSTARAPQRDVSSARHAAGWLAVLLVMSYIVIAQSSPCVGLEASSDNVRAGHDCLGCEWVHVAGAARVARVNGLYRRVNESSAVRFVASPDAKFTWYYGGENLQLQWTSADGGSWLIHSRSAPQKGSSVHYRAKHSASNPLLVSPNTWEWANTTSNFSSQVNASMNVIESDEYFAEKTLRLQCVVNPEDFTMLAGVRELVSFGFNFYGELGRSESLLTLNPVSAPGVVKHFGIGSGAEYVEEVSMGCNHGLARTRDGQLWSWGSNARGQLGRAQSAGTAKANGEPKAIPIDDLGGQGEVDLVVSGGTFSIVRVRLKDNSSKLYTAGSNRFGQLGRKNKNLGVETFNPSFGAVDLANLSSGAVDSEALAVAAGRHHALVRTANGLYSWGQNRYGQLGQERNKGTESANVEPERIVSNFIANGEVQTPDMLALGRFHSLVVTKDGSLFCFGANLRGQCGPTASGGTFQPGSDQPNSVPRLLLPALIGNEAVVAVAAGEYSTMLQTHSGKVWGFGRNFYGQLTAAAGGVGFGTPISMPFHVDVSDLGDSSRVSLLAVGGDHAIMVLSDDGYGSTPDLIGIGSNVFGQLGTTQSVGLAVSHPLLAPSKDSLRCSATFGAAGVGAVGVGAAGVGACASGYMRAIGISTSCDQTVIVTERPQCPAGTNSSHGGVQPCSVCAAGTYQPLAGSSTCYMCAQGLFSYAGSTACLTCGNGTNTTADGAGDTDCLPICRPGQYGVQQGVGLQGLSPCALCSADNYTDEYGATSCQSCPLLYGSTTDGLSSESQCRRFCDEGYFSVDGLEVDGMCSQCPAGKYQPKKRSTLCLGCAVGKFSVNGSSSCSDCARGSSNDLVNASTCSLCDYGSYQEHIGQTSCIMCRADKSTRNLGAFNESDCRVTVFQVWGVGNNFWGQLGAGWVLNSTAQVNSAPVQVANDVGNSGGGLNNDQVLQVSAGFSHTLFLTTERLLWAAGQNVYGQLGKAPVASSACNYADAPDLVCLQDPQPNAIPSYIDASHFNNSELHKVIAGRHVSVALTSDGGVYTWGYNRYGQLGRSRNAGTDLPNWNPLQVSAAMWDQRHIVDVAVGYYHLLLLADDGTVFTMGLNRYGQLGHAGNVGTWLPNWSAVQINPRNLSSSTVVGMAAGASHSLLLTGNQDVWSFGSNGWGQLGTPQQAFVWGGLVYKPVKVMPGIVEVAAGAKHSVVRTNQGKLYGFGSNYYGQLASRTAIGDSTATPLLLKSDIFDGLEIVGLSAGGDNSIVQTVNGSERVLWTFGSNRYGQLAVEENAGQWNFNPDPQIVATCQLMDRAYCDKYTVLGSSVGTGFAMIQTGAKVCPRGTIGPPPHGRPGTAASCQPCAGGQYSSSEGNTVCLSCGTGRYSSAGESSCTQCELGKYSGDVMAASCTACPAGKTMDANTNRTSIDECLQICQPGEAAISTVGGVGAGLCQACVAGKFNSEVGATECTDCPRATYSASHSSNCTACAADTTTYPTGGQSPGDCVALCSPGSYSADGGGGTCTLCPIGMSSVVKGASGCDVCPMGYNTSAPGATSCDAYCQKGTVGANGLQPCAGCSAGKFAAKTKLSQCTHCSAGSYSSTHASVCILCAPGSMAQTVGSAECTLCGPGTLQPLAGSAKCGDCPVGTFSADANSTACQMCAPGFTTNGLSGAGACAACPAGKIPPSYPRTRTLFSISPCTFTHTHLSQRMHTFSHKRRNTRTCTLEHCHVHATSHEYVRVFVQALHCATRRAAATCPLASRVSPAVTPRQPHHIVHCVLVDTSALQAALLSAHGVRAALLCGYMTLQHTATHCHKMTRTATHCNTPQHNAAHCSILQLTAHCSTQHTAHCVRVVPCSGHVYTRLMHDISYPISSLPYPPPHTT